MILPQNIRIATTEDDEQIAKLSVKVWQQSYKEILSSEFLGNLKWESRVLGRREFLENSYRASFAYTLEQKIVGFCDVGPARAVESISEISATFGEIYAIYVLQEYQKLGVGTALYTVAVNYLKCQKFKDLIIWTLVDNKVAITFYLRRGCNLTTWSKNFKAGNQEYSEIALGCNLAEFN